MHRVFVEKHPEHNPDARSLLADLRENLRLDSLETVRVLQRYDIDGLDDARFAQATRLILSEPQIADTSPALDLRENETAFAVEYLPGQYDQRADSAAQCIQILLQEEGGNEKSAGPGGRRCGDEGDGRSASPLISSAQVIVLGGSLTGEQLQSVKDYVINAVDSREASHDLPETLSPPIARPDDVPLLTGFTSDPPEALETRRRDLGLAMSLEDLIFTQSHFRDEESRDPTLTELRMLDTYWSDHCRHTTFATRLAEVTFAPGAEPVEKAWASYQETRRLVYGSPSAGDGAEAKPTGGAQALPQEKPETLMDIALLAMRELRQTDELDNLEVSEEINAASIEIEVEKSSLPPDSRPLPPEKWLLMFKNETHNHPTEIEPFGGAATCLGGCIRDPLSGRAYVFQAMRVTGAADPRAPFEDTLPGKLPQRKICREAARGYSSYGNQIGLATGQVSEIYHPGYLAKRMEIGAVVAAAPKDHVFRGTPAAGDAILLIGGRTGRDGVGGATGSSKEHDHAALENSAEVQKGNPPTERKIQRLFRNPRLARKIKVCNDFGAGGVSVAIGEIAPSLRIDLDAVPRKYEGLDGTELAISESQERMAVCVDPADIPFFLAECNKENLECSQVAEVTDTGRLVITWRDKEIVNFSRAFLDTNGVTQSAAAHVACPGLTSPLYCSHEQERPSLLERSTSPLFRESLGSLGESIADVLRRVHQASERSGIPTPRSRAERHEIERALRSVEERELRRLTEHFLDSSPFLDNWKAAGELCGAEQKVHPTRDGSCFIKANNGSYHGNWLQYLERLHLHSLLFPESSYEILGLIEDDLSLAFLVSQKTARIARDASGKAIGATRSQVEQVMAAQYGAYRVRNDDYYLPEEDLFIEDLHNENVFLHENGESLIFVDPVLFHRPADMEVPSPLDLAAFQKSRLASSLSDLNACSQKGLGEMFDSSIGAGTVLSPFGGKHQLTPPDAMVAKIPLPPCGRRSGDEADDQRECKPASGRSASPCRETTTSSHMAWGFDPRISSWSPYHGALYAVAHSVCRAVASGARLPDIRLTLQEYFPKLGADPARWGQPLAALLGAFTAQKELRLAAIGGKDSMSGSFNDLDVPPTLVSFAVAPGDARLALSPEFKQPGSRLHLLAIPRDADHLPDLQSLREKAALLHQLNREGNLLSLHAPGHSGLAAALAVMAFGNRIGADIETPENLWRERYLHFILETDPATELPAGLEALPIGRTTAAPSLVLNGHPHPLDDLLETWAAPLESTYPTRPPGGEAASPPPASGVPPETPSPPAKPQIKQSKIQNPKSKIQAALPVFPGTNCEYDTEKAFRQAGAQVTPLVFRNLTPAHIEDSLRQLADAIRRSQILMIPGGFSAGDEPDGSGKFIATVLRNPRVADAVMDLLKNRSGLILGICNGFQALVKTGLLPYGEIREPAPGQPTLTFNDIGRHVSCYATTRVASTLSPWLSRCQPGDLHNIPFSHGEGKFIATGSDLADLAANGQIATQYTDHEGAPSMDIRHNPNGSLHAIEGITSPCGRILGKMGHTERRGPHVAQNIPGNKHQPLFKAGVEYFS